MKTLQALDRYLASAIVMMIGALPVFADPSVDFNRDIRPILSKQCFACHGPDEESREADLRLDTAGGATADLEGRRAITPGKPDRSELVRRIMSEDPEKVMPPPDSGHELSDTEKQMLQEWIRAGAEYEIHWSFIPPRKASLPNVKQQDWPTHPTDHFVLARLEMAGLAPADEVDRYRLLRRLSLDLTGLPPTPKDADAFVADETNDALDKMVDRLLASDSFGEHWARMWLDLARYADTKGYEKDRHRDIWRYRDWVIDALNHDVPFDRFTIEQLAGDLLPEPTSDQLLATAFHRNTMTNDEGGTDNEEFRVAAVKDRVDTTLQVWMGLTAGCAKCHSHKYDPVSHSDYYALFGFFNQTEDADRGDDAPTVPTPTAVQARQIADLEVAIKKLDGQSKTEPKTAAAELENARKQLASIRKSIPKTPVMRELATNKQRQTRIHQRGNFLSPGDVVESGVPELFGEFPEDAPRNRLGVARWLMQPQNPLTARVMVNRVWARLFGTGIVETEEDFGTQGTAPTHPQLLDWLAVDFQENGWSLKKLIRSIVLSSSYRQAAVTTRDKLAADPGNRLLSRGPRFRLSAEVVRDQALASAGLLTHKIGGPSVMPPQPPGVWKSTYNALKWQTAAGPDRYRRAVYTYWKRTSPYPAMTTFDAGSGEVCQIRRVRTNTPLQALVTLNDPAFVEAAGALSRRMAQAEGELSDRINYGFRLVLTRLPEEAETKRLVALYELLQSDFDSDREAADSLVKAAGLKNGDAAIIAVANVLLNLDETLMKP